MTDNFGSSNLWDMIPPEAQSVAPARNEATVAYLVGGHSSSRDAYEELYIEQTSHTIANA